MNTKKIRGLIIILILLATLSLLANISLAMAQHGGAVTDSPDYIPAQPLAGSVGQPDGIVNFNTASSGPAASDSGLVSAPSNNLASNPNADENPGAARPASPGTNQAATDNSAAQQQNRLPGSLGSPDKVLAPAATFTYYNLAATAFRPRSYNTNISYSSVGCSYLSASPDWVVADLHIPDGSVIKYIRLYYNVTSSSVSAALTKYDGGQNTTDLVVVSSNTTSGWNYIVSTEITETVDNSAYSYMVLIMPSVTGSTTKYCGVRVAYYAPVTHLVALPIIRNQ